MPPQPKLVCEVCGTVNPPTATECGQCGIRLTTSRNAAEVERLLEEFIEAEPEQPTVKAADESLDLDKEEVAGLVDSIVVPPSRKKPIPASPASRTPTPQRKPTAPRLAPKAVERFECPACGTEVSSSATACSTCGARFGTVEPEAAAQPPPPGPVAASEEAEPSVSVSEPTVSLWRVISGRLIDLVVIGTMIALVGIFFVFKMYSWAAIAAYPIALVLFIAVAGGGFGTGGMLFRISTSAIAQADRLIKDGRYEDAIPLYHRAIRMGTRPAEAWTGKGVAFKRLGRLEEAMKCQDFALKLDAESEIAWCNKGDLYFHMGQLEAAIESYDKALVIRPKYAIAWNNKGAALARAGRYEGARRCHDRAVDLKPKYVAAWLNRGEVLARLGEAEEAARCLERARALGA